MTIIELQGRKDGKNRRFTLSRMMRRGEYGSVTVNGCPFDRLPNDPGEPGTWFVQRGSWVSLGYAPQPQDELAFCVIGQSQLGIGRTQP